VSIACSGRGLETSAAEEGRPRVRGGLDDRCCSDRERGLGDKMPCDSANVLQGLECEGEEFDFDSVGFASASFEDDWS